ncbi:MAG: NAD(P) transhydrogenase subunit alpha, partial [Syntrophomonadaceae bacterium]|nr:NAD(P) transhydrogenase subunit alpha [Syntrophomonadaceae bacterium]
MIIGIPKEIMHGELRVSAIPETVAKLVKDGAEVLVEKSAGVGAHYLDSQYEEAGAQLVEDVAEIYERADVILKVKEPQFNQAKGVHEVDMMHEGQYLITFLHPAAPVNHEMIKNMARKGVIGLTLDGVPRISRAQNMDALTSMSTCAGYKGILLAANELSKFVPQIFCAVGMIKPVNALIIGTGVGGLQALATAKRLGAVVYAADIRPDAAEQAKSLGAKVVDTGVPAEMAVGQGGYALSLSEDVLEKERAILKETVPQMDIVFCGALVPGKLAPVLLTEEMVASMAPGSVIVDISIDQGGNCAITEPGEVVVKHGVTIIGIKNIPGMLATSSTWMFANNICHLVNYLTKDGKVALDRSDEIVASILTTIDGEIVHAGAKEAMG